MLSKEWIKRMLVVSIHFIRNLAFGPSSIVIRFQCNFQWKLKTIKIEMDKSLRNWSTSRANRDKMFRKVQCFSSNSHHVAGAMQGKKHIISVLVELLCIIGNLNGTFFPPWNKIFEIITANQSNAHNSHFVCHMKVVAMQLNSNWKQSHLK